MDNKPRNRHPSLPELLQRRRVQSQHPLLQSAMDFPGVFQQEQQTDECELLPQEVQISEMAQAVRQYGFCVIRRCISTEWLQTKIAPWAKQLQKKVCQALDARNIAWRTASNNTDMFRFREAASRCKGRMDVAVTGGVVKKQHQEFTPLDDINIRQHVLENPTIYPIIQHLLGSDSDSPVQLVYAGLIFNLPGSEDQPWHQDGVPLFPESANAAQIQASLSPYALNVFIPLETSDSSIEKGPTEFLPGSHQWWTDQLAQVNSNETPHDVIAPVLQQGDVLIYDYRVCHRGTSNLVELGSDDKAVGTATRKILYLMYARPWFTDHVNFDYTQSSESIWDTKSPSSKETS
jgi:hypothetical protein